MTADSPSSPSPKPDENPIQRAPKPEMLEKAREIVLEWISGAALEAERVWLPEKSRLVSLIAEALRASEASVESLRKERDDARHIVKLLEQSVDNVIRQREAAHAEATKAEHDRALNWAADFAANHSCDEHCECSDFIAADLRVAAGKYREPSSPTPPTSPRFERIDTKDGVFYRDTWEKQPPTPPSEEPSYVPGSLMSIRGIAPNFTGGLSSEEWIKRRWAGTEDEPEMSESARKLARLFEEHLSKYTPEQQAEMVERALAVPIPSPEPPREEPRE